MLAKKYRLSRKEINLIYKKGRGKRLGEIGIKFLPNRLSHPRFSVIIPKAVVKKVTDRNRFRRVIFDELSKQKSSKNADVIIRIFTISSEAKLRESIPHIINSIDV